MSAEMQLATVPPKETALQVYSAENGLEPYLQQIRAEIDAFVPDISTRKGREAIASIAYKVARSKTALDNAGKELVAELKEVPKKIDAERKRMRDLLDVWQAEVRRPLTEWEEAEEARKAAHQARLDRMHSLVETASADATVMSVDVEGFIHEIEAVAIDASWEEFEPEAARRKDATLSALRTRLQTLQKQEAEQAELERLRREAAAREQKEREERIAREAAERARAEAEQRAQAERDAAARREADALAAAEQARLNAELAEQRRIAAEKQAEIDRQAAIERERIAAEQAERDAQARAEAAAAAERQRQADEQARIKAEADAREADKEHKRAINKEALAAFIAAGMPEDCAKKAIELIAKRQITY